MSDWLLEVTDLKQYTFCPRIVFYRYCLPRIRPITYSMEEGIRSHEEEESREERRSLRNYGLTTGERAFHLATAGAERHRALAQRATHRAALRAGSAAKTGLVPTLKYFENILKIF